MRKVKYILSFVLSTVMLVSMVSCKKETSETTSHDPNKLPPLTHEGKNTFGCLVNGEVWVAYAPFSVGGTADMDGSYTLSTGRFYLKGTKKTSEIFEDVVIGTIEVFSTGNYPMYISHEQVIGFSDYKGNHNCGNFYKIIDSPGTVSITYFSIPEKIISGTFAMDLVNPSCPGDTIRIREGRFDWRMVIYN